MLKKISKGILVSVLWWYVKMYQHKFNPVVIGVAGSVGKTGTKRALAKVLESEKNVAWQDGNYNDIVTVPLIYFGQVEPSLFNPFAWILTLLKMTFILFKNKGADVVVLELGTDTPGQIEAFNGKLKLNYGIVTAVSHEHMENFDDLRNVANEELAIANYTDILFIHHQIEKDGFSTTLKGYQTYGNNKDGKNAYSYLDNHLSITTNLDIYKVKTNFIGEHQFISLQIAIIIAEILKLSKENIVMAIENIQPMSGRMQKLLGKNESLIIDDTYNSSPIAVKAALDYLYECEYQNKIAVLGNMNEMGDISEELHLDVGKYCDPKKLKLLITLGKDANLYLAKNAENNGCKVLRMDNPRLIGEYLSKMDLSDSAILFKGSQNGVFLEEAIKPILKHQNDYSKLVRQNMSWMKQKAKQFEGIL